jgi:hypothetical protein
MKKTQFFHQAVLFIKTYFFNFYLLRRLAGGGFVRRDGKPTVNEFSPWGLK